MKSAVVLVLCLYMVTKTLTLPVDNGEVIDLIKEDCADGDSSCENDCKGETCYNNCQRSRCCSTNYQGGCCNQCRQRCRNTCDRPGRCCKEERITTTPKTVMTLATTIKSKAQSTKVEDSADLTAINKNTADIKTNLLITNKISNVNAVNIPIEVNDRNVNEFVVELEPPASSGKVIKKEKIEPDDDVSEEENNCCNGGGGYNCCNGANTNCCQQNPCSNCLQPGCSQNCNYPVFPQIPFNSPCQLTYYNGNTVTICPNEQATQQYLELTKQQKTKGCKACLYCEGKYQPSVCMKTTECTDICRDYFLDPKTASPVKCTVSDEEYTCQKVY